MKSEKSVTEPMKNKRSLSQSKRPQRGRGHPLVVKYYHRVAKSPGGPDGAYHILFSPKDQNISRIRAVNIEYRITDATKVDENNKFWSINYFWPGDKKALEPSRDLIFENTPKGDSHQSSNIVDRFYYKK